MADNHSMSEAEPGGAEAQAAGDMPVRDRGLSAAEVARQSRAAMLRIVRMVFGVLLFVTAAPYVLNLDFGGAHGSGLSDVLTAQWYIPFSAALVLGLLAIALDILTPAKKISTISGIFFGLLVGLIASLAVSMILDLLAKSYDVVWPQYMPTIKVLFGIVLCYLGVSAVLQTQDDFRLVIPFVEFTRQIRGPRPMFLDSSALIDARIADLASAGIVSGPLVIPEFVLLELQRLADSQDRLKRARGRRGLDVATRLQRAAPVEIIIDREEAHGSGVDQMLVDLARQRAGVVVTTDTGLARLATIAQVDVVNVNDVAAALRPSLVPGTGLSLRLVRQGEQTHQGVGFLEDGTMIVVDQASRLIGSEVQVEVTSTLQTSGGRLIFAKLVTDDPNIVRPGPDPNMPAEPEAGVPGPMLGAPVRAMPPTTQEGPGVGGGRGGPMGPGHGPRNPLRNPRR